MPKISVAGGPTDESTPGYYAPGRAGRSPNVTSTEGSEGVSRGSSSASSVTSIGRNEPSAGSARQSSAPPTATPLRKARQVNSTARSAGTSSNPVRGGR